MSTAIKPMPGEQRFRRMTLLQRGHFPNTVIFRPISEITIDGSGITLTRGGRQYRYKWSQIKRARILSEESFKGYGRAASGKFIKRTFILDFADKCRFKFDVSEDFPDFENSGDLLKALHKHLTVTESMVKPYNYLPWIVLAVIVLLIGMALKQLGL
jgi:hypothetical protein